MRIGFIIPGQEYAWDSVHQGLGYVAAYAVKHCSITSCDIFRTAHRSRQDLVDFLERGWDVIGLTLTNPTVVEAREISQLIKANSPSTYVVVGGAEVTTVREEILKQLPHVDSSVAGEGELTFAELLHCLSGKESLSSVNGLIYRKSDDTIVSNPPRQFSRDLEQFPVPDRTISHYPYDFHSIIGTRGCPFKCTFCNSADNWDHLYNRRAPKAIAEEVKYIIGLYGRKKFIAFTDDLFNLKKSWVIEVCEELKPLKVSWWIRGMRADQVTEEVADALVNSGCIGAAVGVESANNEALKIMKKATTIEKIMRGVRIMQERGLPINGQFIIRNQGDTLETVKESIECAREFSQSTFGIAYPIPHTQLADYVKQHNLLLPKPVPVQHEGKTIDWVLFDTPHLTVEQRLKAIELAIDAKVYHTINYLETETLEMA